MTDTPSRLASALVDRYRIQRELGAGGMATVYLAEDLKHNRQVAIKVLRPELAAVVGAERFFSEIETTAQLQHPNILPLFDSGEADGLLFYAMPYVEGETLADRLARERQLPVDVALDVTRKLAAALDYAHQRGVVHRDIKPANVLLSSGEPLIADFGIALAVTQAGDGRITETGLSLGTPHYMSPEQASGDRSLDPRSDVYALACVLYEMLIGEPPFAGPSPQAVLARILTTSPTRVTQARPTVPRHVDAVVARALEKLPADRFATMGDFRRALDDPSFRHTTGTHEVAAAPVATAPHASSRRWVVPALSGACLVLAAVSALAWIRPGPVQPVHRFRIALDVVDVDGRDFAISPDGGRIVYIGEGMQLFQRPLSSLEGQAIPGAQPARGGFFSPDGASVGFDLGTGASDRMHTVSLAGGSPIPVGTPGRGVSPDGAWTEDGYIYYLEDVSGEAPRLVRAPARGGDAEPVQTNATVFFMAPLPGVTDRLLVTFVDSLADGVSTGILHVETGVVRRIPGLEGAGSALFAGGYLFWYSAQGGSLVAAGFSPAKGELTTPPVTLTEGLSAPRSHYVSDAGILVYWSGVFGGVVGGEAPGWVDRSGGTEVIDARLSEDVGDFDDVRLSPDGRYLAVDVQSGADGAPDEAHRIRIYDLQQGTSYQLSFEGRFNTKPRWMPDGRVAYLSDQSGRSGVWAQPYDRSGVETLLFESDGGIVGLDVSPVAGAPLLVTLEVPNAAGATDAGLFLVDPDSGSDPRPFVDTRFVEAGGAISPDGRWAAYTSYESGRSEVYVRAFPGGGRPYPISVGGAVAPAWGAEGDELVYVTPEGITVAALDVADGVFVRSRDLITDDTDAFEWIRGFEAGFDVATDGRLVTIFERRAQLGGGSQRPMPVVVTNVFEDLRRRLEQGGGG